MKRKLTAILWFFALCAVLLSACAAKAPMEPMTITVISRVYEEVEPEKVQALHLAVESCEGLTEIGEIDPHNRKTYRLVYDKDKRDYVYKSVHVEDKAYAYPDAGYPNLVVALVDGEPVIFQFCNFVGNGEAELETIYGAISPDTIDRIEICAYHREVERNTEVTVSDKQDLAAFCDAYHAELPAYELIAAERSDPEADLDYPQYSVTINLTNGFFIDLCCYPRQYALHCANRWYPCSEQLREWFESHAK